MSRYDIKVMGVGGGGCNTIDYLVDNKVQNITTYAVNTDAQALDNSKADKKIHIGKKVTNGLGAGALPEIGRTAAEESHDEIVKEIQGADIVFVAAGMGGGTGTGAAPYIASIAKKLGILTIGIVTKPFNFEGPTRMNMALKGLTEFENNTDITVVIPNEKLIQSYKDYFIEDAFILPDSVLKDAIESIVFVLESVSEFTVNIDLNRLRTTLCDKGLAVMGYGSSDDAELSATENVIQATKNAINSEILEVSVSGAKEFIALITANSNYMTMEEVEVIGQYLTNTLQYTIQVVLSVEHDSNYNEHERKVTIIATGYENKEFIEQITKPEERKKFADELFVGI